MATPIPLGKMEIVRGMENSNLKDAVLPGEEPIQGDGMQRLGQIRMRERTVHVGALRTSRRGAKVHPKVVNSRCSNLWEATRLRGRTRRA